MKNERILNALSRADDKYVEEAAPANPVKAKRFDEGEQGETVTVTAPKRKIYGSRIAAAACACIAVGGLVVWGAVGGLGNLTEDPASGGTGNNGQVYETTGSPELNGYHNFTMTRDELYYCPWACFLPAHYPAGYDMLGDAQCTEANGLAQTYSDLSINFWLSNGIDDPDAEGYNPIFFNLTVGEGGVVESSPVYELQTLTVEDIAEMGNGGFIRCSPDVRIMVTLPHPERVDDLEIYKMIKSMPYANDWLQDITRSEEYLTKEEAYSTVFADSLPSILPSGYFITGPSLYTYNDLAFDGGGSIRLCLSNGVEDPKALNYCPIRYTAQTYTDKTDTRDLPMYQSVSEVTPENIKTAMERGGFYVRNQSHLIKVTFLYPDRLSAEEMYRMIGSVAREDGFGYITDHPTREELYNLPYSRAYAPRLLPKGYELEKAVHTVYEEGHYCESLDLYISNGIQNTGNDYNLIFFSIVIDSSLTSEPKYDIKTITAGDIEKELKQNNDISFKCGDKAVVSINVDKPLSSVMADKSRLITADELYRMIMSMPISGRFEESGIKTGELPEGITTYNVPVVDINEYYDVQRYPINGQILNEDSHIYGFDGENLYIRDILREGDFDDIHSPLGSSLRQYNVVTGESRTLISEMGAIFWIIYADGQNVYYNKALLSQENHLMGTEINMLSLDTGEEVTILTLWPNALHYSLPMEDKNEIWIATEYEDREVIMRLDMTNIFGEKIFCEVESFSVEYMTPYKDGVLFETGKLGDGWKREVYFWDGINEPFLICTRDHDFYTVGDTILYAEVEETAEDGSSNIQAFLKSYDLSDPSYGLGVPPSDCLAVSDKLYWILDGGRLSVISADGMVAEENGIIYDAKNGWFSHIQGDGDYDIVGRDISSNTLVLFELDHSNATLSWDGVFDGDIVAVYVVKRK